MRQLACSVWRAIGWALIPVALGDFIFSFSMSVFCQIWWMLCLLLSCLLGCLYLLKVLWDLFIFLVFSFLCYSGLVPDWSIAPQCFILGCSLNVFPILRTKMYRFVYFKALRSRKLVWDGCGLHCSWRYLIFLFLLSDSCQSEWSDGRHWTVAGWCGWCEWQIFIHLTGILRNINSKTL